MASLSKESLTPNLTSKFCEVSEVLIIDQVTNGICCGDIKFA